ncbi:hypothetical protein AMK59_8786, partial [Oryctes borbonicus]
EERAISKLCGYPICGKKIPDMPKQKYIISTKVNRVYDISERKNYCSNFCYQGSLFVKNQIESSPLWLRNHTEMPECKLMPVTAVATPGEEVNYGLLKEKSDLSQFTSITHFAQISLEEVENIEKIPKNGTKCNMKHKKIQKQSSLGLIEEDTNKEAEMDDCDLHQNSDEYRKKDTATNKTFLSGTELIQDNKGKEPLRKKSDEREKLEYLIAKLKVNSEPKIKLINLPPTPHSSKSKVLINEKEHVVSKKDTKDKVVEKTANKEVNTNAEFVELLNNVKTCVEEWITLDSFIYLYTEDKVRQILNENKMEEYFDKLKIPDREIPQQMKYMNICKRLHIQELAEDKFDKALLGKSIKPLPDFKQLKEEVQELDLKVRSFYKGALYEQMDTNFPTKPIKENQESTEEAVTLPLVDASAQNTLRRKVFFNSINKTMKKLIVGLKLDERYVLLCMQDLVKSFKLQSHNVVFKPNIWPIIAVILIKILCIKDVNIQMQVEEPRSVEYIELILSKYAG